MRMEASLIRPRKRITGLLKLLEMAREADLMTLSEMRRILMSVGISRSHADRIIGELKSLKIAEKEEGSLYRINVREFERSLEVR
jgi:DNA-binding IscR family transcriptional regulator